MTNIQRDALFLSKELFRVQAFAEKYYNDNAILKLKYFQLVMPSLLLECYRILLAMSETQCKTTKAAAEETGFKTCNTL